MKYNLLALDASTEALSLALSYNGNLYRHFEECPQQHSQKILPLVEQLFTEAGCQLKDLDGLVFGRGPGSFTGVRIGVAVAQGLAYSGNLQLAGVSTLQAMAQQAFAQTQAKQVLVAIDARMGEVYLCHYTRSDNNQAIALGEERVIKPELIDGEFEGVLAVGTGWQTYSDVAEKLGLEVHNDITLPHAEYMLDTGIAQFEAGKVVNAADAQPRYVRDTVTWKKLPGRE
ncbi:tRNA (adenosine(37)-N6)-threonylcarbamoyltransferase complex dimerization subunit type 1 TsaB [Pseudoalteromonas rubra]|uniref:tRNA threonylcarbamoyladenosine biosynthesis protein TsaB n=1 Tax=Pseudoalteromonas rubra TaxID=43658 RepID=A0A0U3H2Q4_9GAMM|nr:tRNA (adenosine(37)-N6)-threonylcarbamoyltransferase complex dimerization subunit type 1 TsaB [Pseudoalteromonas rubra]ALU45603.1 tRNA threonylcarbamoyladenosine biosynthesis protein TsaB [Pseudoalteromonas rubra]